jgi:hypothetical protein
MLTAGHPSLRKAVEKAEVEKVKLDLFKQAPLFVPEPASKWSAGYGMVWAVPRNNQHKDQTLVESRKLVPPVL